METRGNMKRNHISMSSYIVTEVLPRFHSFKSWGINFRR